MARRGSATTDGPRVAGGRERAKIVRAAPKPKAKRGRPTKLSERAQAAAVDAVRQGATREIAAAAAGVHQATLFRWLADGEAGSPQYRDFYDAIKRAEAECALSALGQIRAHAEETWQAAAWLLERRYRESYGRMRVEVEPVGKVAEALAALLGVTTAELPEDGDALA
jgi:transposase